VAQFRANRDLCNRPPVECDVAHRVRRCHSSRNRVDGTRRHPRLASVIALLSALFVLTVFGIGLMPAHRARRMMSGTDEPSCVAWPWRLVVLGGGKHQAPLDYQA